MIYGIGVDIASTARFASLAEGVVERILSEEELGSGRCTDAEFLSSRFAAKEAFSKALGTGIRGFSMKEITIREDEMGRPYYHLEGRALALAEGLSFHLSISHDGGSSVAMAVAEYEK